jgi:hypothetical protein
MRARFDFRVVFQGEEAIHGEVHRLDWRRIDGVDGVGAMVGGTGFSQGAGKSASGRGWQAIAAVIE